MNLRQQIKVAAVKSALELPVIPTTLARQRQQQEEFAKTGFDELDFDIWLGEFMQVQQSLFSVANQKAPSEIAKEQAEQAAKIAAAQPNAQ
jgi:hypothetical protein